MACADSNVNKMTENKKNGHTNLVAKRHTSVEAIDKC